MDDLPVRYAEMGGFPLNDDDEPIRLFRQNFLEFFTHISPVAVIAIWAPVIAWLLARAALGYIGEGYPFFIPLGAIIGMFSWTLVEYTVHRFIFHFHPGSVRAKRLVFLFHGIHHAQPQCKTRLVMPPAVSVPGAFLVYGLLSFGLGGLLGLPDWVDPVMAGLAFGYLVYDLIHYATHHFPMRWGFLKFLKRYHMQHHYKTPARRFGVSSPLWDWVFGTRP
jgi:sterol desaturase/sphingolipid hydroxylase (fatty acid hydroxylase superfamily)